MEITASPSSMPSPVKPIALLVTAYNRQHKLGRMLRSLRDELHLLDIILVDDGSMPPIDISTYTDYPIQLVRLEQNQGVMAASNAGLRLILEAGYEFIARLDSDDIAVNNRFATQLAFMREHEEIGLAASNYIVCDEAGNELHRTQRLLTPARTAQIMLVTNVMHHPTFIMRASAVRDTGMYNEQFKAAGDYEFVRRLMCKHAVAIIPQQLICYECGAPDSISTKKKNLQIWNMLKTKCRFFVWSSPYSYAGILFALFEFLGLGAYFNDIYAWMTQQNKK